jgi:hypothetical protein
MVASKSLPKPKEFAGIINKGSQYLLKQFHFASKRLIAAARLVQKVCPFLGLSFICRVKQALDPRLSLDYHVRTLIFKGLRHPEWYTPSYPNPK